MWQDLRWNEGACAESLQTGILQISDFLRSEANRRLAQAKEEERRLHRGVASLQRQLETHPTSEWVGEQLEEAQQELRWVKERRHEFLFHRQASHWVRSGDRVTGDFFSIVRPRHSRTGVQRLRAGMDPLPPLQRR